ncbi:unnamed protein product [Euphydryas editha]|uniref:Protein Wnt n=1 Tax=Euphydryas editha TaxID=104508 RepID=A0AAU9V0Q1_EUPED|nr:unnamed protein product [Euphydryas editha]
MAISISGLLDRSRDSVLPHQLKLSSSLTCRLIGGLTREQRAICHNSADTAAVAFEGLQMSVKECQHQFRWHRWNCSSLLSKNANPHASSIMKRGFRETAFLYALTAAGVAHAIARACAQGRLLSCGCDPLGYRASHDRGRARVNKWEWSGCSHNLAFGIEFSKKFLDVREEVDDLQSKINVHNNNAGRSTEGNDMTKGEMTPLDYNGPSATLLDALHNICLIFEGVNTE